MRVVFCSDFHRYPATHWPIGNGGQAGYRVLDTIARGVAELGHDVTYYLPRGVAAPLPPGITHATTLTFDFDALHYQMGDLTDPMLDIRGLPWVRTCHTDLLARGQDRSYAKPNWVYVSRTLARSYGSGRYVLNGIDPAELTYSAAKDDYVLFMCDLHRAARKGFDVAVELCRTLGFRLVVAGSSIDPNDVLALRRQAAGADVRFVGEVFGTHKAELLAGAKALLFPTRINEAFGLVVAEALMSGTPVIASDLGACPELVSEDVGFVCGSTSDYVRAFERLETIDPAACRAKAMRDFHYLRMAAEYVREYEVEAGAAAVAS